MKLNSLQLLILLFVALWAEGALGQCSATAPCVPVQVTATQGNYTGLQICVGDAIMCSAANLNSFIQTGSSPYWKSVGFYQKAATVTYYDPHSYGSTIYYAANSTAQGGAPGPPSAITFFQMPAAPQTPPTLIVGPKIVTTGTPGVQ